MSDSSIRVGTSSWSSAHWCGPFYPPDARSTDFLACYAQHFDTVECDATFYRTPSAKTLDGWRTKTPQGFLFAAKLPREITHERGLVDCEHLIARFLEVMERLGDRLGPLLAQIPYVAAETNPEEYATGSDFLRRLSGFLDSWPQERKLAVEVRNASWIAPPLLDLLEKKRVALALSAYPTMPSPDQLCVGPDPQTTDWMYLRFIGDRKRMDAVLTQLRREEKRTDAWSAVAVDRTEEMTRWIRYLRPRVEDKIVALTYFNDHYAGFAPGSALAFRDLWQRE